MLSSTCPPTSSSSSSLLGLAEGSSNDKCNWNDLFADFYSSSPFSVLGSGGV